MLPCSIYIIARTKLMTIYLGYKIFPFFLQIKFIVLIKVKFKKKRIITRDKNYKLDYNSIRNDKLDIYGYLFSL